MDKRKLGYFIIVDDIMRDPLDYLELFKDVVVLQVEDLPMEGKKKYYAASKWFASVKEGMMIPEYVAVFGKGDVTPKWKMLG